MKRPNVNFTIDCLGFTLFVLLAATGVLMRYVLPPGSGRFNTVWTLDRHEWGSIHFWLAIGLLAVLAFHLFLHWRWIVALMTGRPRQGSGARVVLGIVGLASLLALLIALFLSPVERSGGDLHGPQQHRREGRGHGQRGDVLKNTEAKLITRTLEKHNGNRTRATQELGIHRATFFRKIERCGLSWSPAGASHARPTRFPGDVPLTRLLGEVDWSMTRLGLDLPSTGTEA